MAQPINLLRRTVHHFSDQGLLAIGSGGSFTAAAFAADLHLRSFGQVSQAVTPLDIFNLPPNRAPGAAALLLSAEGKNNDILAAAYELLRRSCPTVALSLKAASPLADLCEATRCATLMAFEMPWGKDGYLATNSLVACLILIWRAYDEAVDIGELEDLIAWFLAFISHV